MVKMKTDEAKAYQEGQKAERERILKIINKYYKDTLHDFVSKELKAKINEVGK